MLQEVQNHRDRHVVGQVGYQRCWFDGKVRDLHGVSLDEVEIPDGGRPPFSHSGRKLGGEDGIDLHCHDGRGGVQQAQRQ